MALDTFSTLSGRVRLSCPAADPFLAKEWISHAFRQVAERRRWSWLIKRGQFIIPAVYNTGTVTVTLNSPTVTGSGTTFTGQMVGRQFRTATTAPIYTIAAYNSATSITLDQPWGAATASTQGYEIWQAYVTPADDFHAFVCVWDPSLNWQLYLNYQQNEINRWDAQRATSGSAYIISAIDYSTSSVGTVASPVQVDGSGPDPTSAGTYTGAADALFTVEITTGGAAGTAVYRWKKDAGSYTSSVTTDAGGAAQDLQDGVQVVFPLAQTYVVGDIWVIQCKTINTVGLPRYEVWPHVKAAYVYPYLYESRATDLEDTGAVLPRYIRGDALLEMALASAARWPGLSKDKEKQNPYFSLGLALNHERRAEQMIYEMERQDDEVMMQDLTYYTNLPYPQLPFDAAFLQSHAL